jgi:pyruvate,water dikinase
MDHQVTWQAPGAGQWTAEAAHSLGAMTPIGQLLMTEGMTKGTAELFLLYGMPAESLECRFVRGHMYTRLRPLIRPDHGATKQPPAILLKLAFRIHPELRRRVRQAERTLAEQPWRAAVREWQHHERDAVQRANLALQRVAPADLDDDALAAHWTAALDHALTMWRRHFVLHGYDLGPIGLLLVAADDWGLPAVDVASALRGASPSTSEPSRVLTRLRAEVTAAGVTPRSLDDVRAVSATASAELDRYLELRGWQLVTRYDVDGLTLGEMPAVVLTAILHGADVGGSTDPDVVAAGLRAQVPEADRAEFDDLLTEARLAMDLRDENGPLTAEWTGGLVRRALLEIGRRLHRRGTTLETAHVFELEADEVTPLLVAGRGPTGDELARRAALRRADAALDLPTVLGPAEPDPPLDVLPAATATLLRAVRAVLDKLGREQHSAPLAGTGIGTEVYKGRARRAATPEDAIAELEPGDVLVVPYTTPAYNTVLPLAGAIVTAEGGPLSHAAVLARELGIPAVVGVSGAMAVPDGAALEVDPVAGLVRIV